MFCHHVDFRTSDSKRQFHVSLKTTIRKSVQCTVAGCVINVSLISWKYLVNLNTRIIKSLSLQMRALLRGFNNLVLSIILLLLHL